MEDKKYLRKPEIKKSPYNEMNFDLESMASATDYTGLMPTPPRTKSQLNSYRQLYPSSMPLTPPKRKKAK